MGKIELLAPAGDFACLRAAVEAGADAVYFGMQNFNMRDNAKNFIVKDLDKINEICGKKVKKYVTINTIIYDNEINEVEKLIKKIKGKVDAVICWDLSVIQLCKKHKIPFHISTQASVANSEAAEFFKRTGAERIVLARELNLNQVKKITKVIDVEVFAHGAMCVSESGRCFTSQFLFNRSANRGQCIHPCRRAYYVKDEEGNELILEKSRVMSAKDLCTLSFIELLKKSGIKAIKIEGRNRNAEYVSAVVSSYRKALDKKLNREEIIEELNKLKKVYNRGFSSGFYLGLPSADDFSKSEHGEGEESKRFIGKVQKYWPKSGAAAVYVNTGKIKIGDEVYILGNETGVKRARIESMEIEGMKIEKAKKGELVGIALPNCKKGDEIYLIVKRHFH